MTHLEAYLRQQQLSAFAFAKKLGVDPSLVSRWRRGETRPAYDRMVLIERETDGAVPVSAWANHSPKMHGAHAKTEKMVNGAGS